MIVSTLFRPVHFLRPDFASYGMHHAAVHVLRRMGVLPSVAGVNIRTSYGGVMPASSLGSSLGCVPSLVHIQMFQAEGSVGLVSALPVALAGYWFGVGRWRLLLRWLAGSACGHLQLSGQLVF